MDLSVILADGSTIYLNSRLVDRNDVSAREIEQIKKVHFDKSVIFEEMKKTRAKKKLKELSKKVKELEFKLQRLWGFELNSEFHEWYLVPKCKCPKSDNYDRRGSNNQIIDSKCPVHGD